MKVYKAVNSISGTVYYGITINFYNRKATHKSCAKHKRYKCPFYDAINKYGWENFNWYTIKDCDTKEEAQLLEQTLIQRSRKLNFPTYNLHDGGSIGFSMRNKSPEEYQAWKDALSKARQGRTPALGMKHSDEAIAYCTKVSKEYWATQYVYPDEVVNLSFIKAKAKYGISKTHYYRIRKRVLANA